MPDRKEGLADYVLAGRALTFPAFVATLVPSFYGGAMGIGEFTWRGGLANWTVMAAPYYVFALLYAFFLAGKVRATPGLTIADHVEGAYGRPLAVFSAALVFLLASPADELLAVGVLAGDVFGVSTLAAVVVVAALTAALLWNGGLRADARANAVQFILMFAGFAALAAFAWAKFGAPSALASLLPAGHLTWTGGLSPMRLLAWWLIAVWTVVDPIFHQRCAAAESPRVAKNGVAASVACWALFDLMTTSCGLYARAALPDLQEPMLAFPRLAAVVLPSGARWLFLAGLASSLLAGLQGQALQSSISLGKDGLGRLLRADEKTQRRLTKLSLILTLSLGCVLAAWIPSVVGLWYAVGSAVIPGLLWPLLGVYYPRARPSPRWALAASAGGFALAAAWVALGQRAGTPPFGLDPMFPGLALASAAWVAGLVARAR